MLAFSTRQLLRHTGGRGARQLWLSALSTDPSAAAAISEISQHIRAKIGTRTSSQPDSCFVLVSQTYPAHSIDRLSAALARQLTSGTGRQVNVAGTVVDRVMGGDASKVTAVPGIAVLYHTQSADTHAKPKLTGRPFYIGDMHGRQRLREVAVGRWHNETTDRRKHAASVEARWSRGESSVTQAGSHLVLPKELADIEDAKSVRMILLASDKESRQVLDALDARFPTATKIGVVGTQTPFVNGREFTLFGMSQVHDSGVVGLAFIDADSSSSGDDFAAAEVACRGLVAVTEPQRIVRCKGNVVLELEDGEAARTLIAAVRRRRLETGGQGLDHRLFAKIIDGSNSLVLQVTGGDPAKGGLAIDTLKDISAGQSIQFLMRADHQAESLPSLEVPGGGSDKLAVVLAADDISIANQATGGAGSTGVASSVFGGVTEGGFIFGKHSPTPAKPHSIFAGSSESAVPGSTLTLHIDGTMG
ncbi:hypothetical protein EC988_001847 [Linderina pennispora]|nr:hypothetical protein EC988_001847 [Linderina pennispora]